MNEARSLKDATSRFHPSVNGVPVVVVLLGNREVMAHLIGESMAKVLEQNDVLKLAPFPSVEGVGSMSDDLLVMWKKHGAVPASLRVEMLMFGNGERLVDALLVPIEYSHGESECVVVVVAVEGSVAERKGLEVLESMRKRPFWSQTVSTPQDGRVPRFVRARFVVGDIANSSAVSGREELDDEAHLEALNLDVVRAALGELPRILAERRRAHL